MKNTNGNEIDTDAPAAAGAPAASASAAAPVFTTVFTVVEQLSTLAKMHYALL